MDGLTKKQKRALRKAKIKAEQRANALARTEPPTSSQATPPPWRERYHSIINLAAFGLFASVSVAAFTAADMLIANLIFAAVLIAVAILVATSPNWSPRAKWTVFALAALAIGALDSTAIYRHEDAVSETFMVSKFDELKNLIGSLRAPPAPKSKRPPDEKLPGFGNGMVVRTNDLQEVRRQVQYSFSTPDGAKVTFYLAASNHYVFSVTNVRGDEYNLDIPLGANGIPFEEWAYIFCEVGTASGYSYLRAMLNGKEIARRDFEFPIDLGSRKWRIVLGADANGQNGGSFMMTEFGYHSTTLTDVELMAIATNALTAYGLKP